MVQKDISRTGRVDTKTRPDDAAAGVMREDRLVLEIVFEVFGDGHGKEGNELVKVRFAELVKLLLHSGERISFIHGVAAAAV